MNWNEDAPCQGGTEAFDVIALNNGSTKWGSGFPISLSLDNKEGFSIVLIGHPFPHLSPAAKRNRSELQTLLIFSLLRCVSTISPPPKIVRTIIKQLYIMQQRIMMISTAVYYTPYK
jgi:hypothetical protein